MGAPGGFLEHASSTVIRPQPIRMTLPQRGAFDFPSPYRTRGIRITNNVDADNLDCLTPGYAYWPRISAHADQTFFHVFACFDRNRGGSGPCVYRVDKASEEVTPLGPILADHRLAWENGERWYWSLRDPDLLYCCDLSRLYRYHVSTRELEVVVDIEQGVYANSGRVLWQFSSSADDKTHAATVKNGTTWAIEGALVYREGVSPNPFIYFTSSPLGLMDESQIDKTGEWLVVKDNLDGVAGEDNKLVRLADWTERILWDQKGAGGHSDNGYGYMAAADNYNDMPGAVRLWMFNGSDPWGKLVYHTPNWDAQANHFSHVNAVPGAPDDQIVLGSGASFKVQPRNNELIAFPLDGSLETLIIAPTLTDPRAPGGDAKPGEVGYRQYPGACFDVTGEWACWTSNLSGARLDMLLVRVPKQLLVPTPPPPEHECTHACPVHCPYITIQTHGVL